MSPKITVEVLVKQQNGSPAQLAMIQVYKHGCIWFVCIDNYQYTLMTDLYGRAVISLDVGEWLIRGLWRGQAGDARFNLTTTSVGTVKQSGTLNVMAYKR